MLEGLIQAVLVRSMLQFLRGILPEGWMTERRIKSLVILLSFAVVTLNGNPAIKMGLSFEPAWLTQVAGTVLVAIGAMAAHDGLRKLSV